MGAFAKVKNFFGAQDMTCGKPFTGLMKFSIPLLIGNLAQQLYNTVDSIIVGRYIGDTALAAVGAAGPIINLLIVLFMGISTGATVLVSQYFGAREREQLNKTVGTSIFLTFVTSIVMTFVGYFASPAMVSLMKTPVEVEAAATIYLKIVFIGMLGAGFYNIVSGILRGMGDSVWPLIFLVLASLMNIVLDIVFVRNLSMGVAGVAWATIISQAVSGVLCVVRLFFMKNVVDMKGKYLKPDGSLTKKLCTLGIPAGITQAIFSLASIMTQSLTNSMGAAVMAVSVAVMRVDGFCMMPNFTWGTAATTYVGQNVGAKNGKRIVTGVKSLIKTGLVCSTILVACILLFGPQLISMFSSTPEVIMLGAREFRWLALGYIVFSVSQVLQGVMRGAGETVAPMWISIITTVIIRMPLAYLFAFLTRSETWPMGHPDSMFASLLVAWVLACVFTVIVYRRGNWKKRLPDEVRAEL